MIYISKGDEHKATEFLRTFGETRSEYNAARLALEEVETQINHITIDYEKTRVKTSPKPDKYADIIDRLIYLRREYIEAADLASKAMEETYRAITKVKDATSRDLLTRFYISGQTWTEIAGALGYSMSGIFKLRKRALSNFIQENPEIIKRVY